MNHADLVRRIEGIFNRENRERGDLFYIEWIETPHEVSYYGELSYQYLNLEGAKVVVSDFGNVETPINPVWQNPTLRRQSSRVNIEKFRGQVSIQTIYSLIHYEAREAGIEIDRYLRMILDGTSPELINQVGKNSIDEDLISSLIEGANS